VKKRTRSVGIVGPIIIALAIIIFIVGAVLAVLHDYGV
jgi:hypothetical protein